MKKYRVIASQTQIAQYEIEVKAKNKEDAGEIALETDMNKWSAYDPYSEDPLLVDEIKEVNREDT